MQIALVNSSKKSKLYPLPLMKISTYLKAQGHTVEYFDNKPPNKKFDEVWITTLFTFEIDYSIKLINASFKKSNIIRAGGVSVSLMPNIFKKTGATVHVGIHKQIEKCTPDYSILPITIPEYSITHTSRGCVRACGFCMVHKLEPEYFTRNWKDDIHPKSKKILFYDNNWTAKSLKEKEKDVSILWDVIKKGVVKEIDFNQGMDCRLMDEDTAKLLKGLPIKPVRFAFDGMHENGYWQKAVDLMVKYGHKNFRNYVLYNFNDTPQDFYYRLKEHIIISNKYNISCEAYPMRYQPIMQIDKSRNYVGKHWTERQKKNFMLILAKHSIMGQVSCSSLKEFEFWFGKNDDQFVKILNYPKCGELASRKKDTLYKLRKEKKW